MNDTGCKKVAVIAACLDNEKQVGRGFVDRPVGAAPMIVGYHK